MNQLEVKRWLMEHRFPPSEGWYLTVDIDTMERANGDLHPAGKKEAAGLAEAALRSAGATIVAHPVHGRAGTRLSNIGIDAGRKYVELAQRERRSLDQVRDHVPSIYLQLDGPSTEFIVGRAQGLVQAWVAVYEIEAVRTGSAGPNAYRKRLAIPS